MSDGIPVPDAALAAIEESINHYLSLDPEGAQRLAELHGRVILIEVAGFGTRLYLIPGTKGVQLYGDYAGEPDCVLRGTPMALARMGTSRQKEDQLFSGEVQIEGDTHLAQALGDLVGGLEVDWEEHLSRLVGDGVARKVGDRARSAERWRRRTGDAFNSDLKDYLQEEARLLPSRYEVLDFLEDVDQLRDGVERLAVRVERLKKKREG